MALTDKSSIVVPKGFYGKANVLQGFNPQTENLVDLDVVRNTTATRVNEQGLIESVAANVPRRDFLNGGCGELLVEPQRTNLVLRSEEFDNAYWSLGAATITANSTISPDGTTTADTLTATGAGGVVLRAGLWDTTQKTASVFVKNDNCNEFRIEDASAANGVSFNIVSGSVISEDAGFSGSIVSYGDGWFRAMATYTAPASRSLGFKIPASGESAFIWGAQLEEGEYPTSYIPTTASAVTRNQDNISLTGAADLLGDSAGGMLVEAAAFDVTEINSITLNGGSSNNRVLINLSVNNLRYNITVGGVTEVNEVGKSISSDSFYKVALAYATNDFKAYADGVVDATDNVVNTFTSGTLDEVDFSNGNGLTPFYGRIRQLVIFDQALTDAELIALTS